MSSRSLFVNLHLKVGPQTHKGLRSVVRFLPKQATTVSLWVLQSPILAPKYMSHIEHCHYIELILLLVITFITNCSKWPKAICQIPPKCGRATLILTKGHLYMYIQYSVCVTTALSHLPTVETPPKGGTK